MKNSEKGKKLMGLRSQWIGSEFGVWSRVCLAFEAVGYLPPTPDTEQGTGAYAANIVAQYVNELSEQEALDVIAFGLQESAEFLRNNKGMLSTHDVAGSTESYEALRAESAQVAQQRKIDAAQRAYEKKLDRHFRDTATTHVTGSW